MSKQFDLWHEMQKRMHEFFDSKEPDRSVAPLIDTSPSNEGVGEAAEWPALYSMVDETRKENDQGN